VISLPNFNNGGDLMTTKHLLNGVAVIAALAFSAPVWAQPANPSGGNSMSMPGPNMGGPGLTPYSTAPPPAAAPSGRMPAGGRATSEPTNIPPTASDTTSATPPKHHRTHAMHAMHGKKMPGPTSTTDTTAQLNQAELARLQTGSSMPPPAPMGAMPPPAPMPRPPTQGGNSMAMPGPNTGGPGLTPYSSGTPQR
jgi:hypothetical protein